MTDVLVVGRLLADIYPNQLETPLSEVRTFTRFVGGFAGNVATGLARLGIGVSILSRVGDDGHGEFVRHFLEAEGVDCGWVGVDPEWRTGLAFCEAWPPDHFPITYYRTPSCPDWEITLDDFDMAAARAIPWLLLTGTGLARSPSREVHYALAQERSGRAQTVLDLDWRHMLWDDRRTYRACVKAVLPYVDLVIGNVSEWEALGDDALETAASVVRAGPHAAIVKRGPDGVLALTADGATDVPGLAVPVVNGLGAGDAFCASVIAGLLRGTTLAEACSRGNAAGAVVATRLSCSEAMPTEAEIDALLATGVVPPEPVR